MKYLITGAEGFIGSHLAKALQGDVIKFDILNKQDVRDEYLVEETLKDVDIVFHLAAIVGVENASRYPLKVLNTELKGIENVLKYSLLNDVRKVVYTSSSEVYGDVTPPFKEDVPVTPLSTYGVAKLAAEKYCEAYNERGLKTTCLRIFNAYGKGQSSKFVVPRFIVDAMGKEIKVYSDGAQTRDFTYIDDVIRGLIMASEGPSGIFNIGTGIETSIRTLAEKIQKLIPSEIKTIPFPATRRKDYEVSRRVADINKSKNVLGFEAKTSLEKGLKNIIE